MSKERELLKETLSFLVLDWDRGKKLYSQIEELLAQPEPEPTQNIISDLRDDLVTLKGLVPVRQILEAFPLLDEKGLDQEQHHCEWVLQQERKRLHAMLFNPLQLLAQPEQDLREEPVVWQVIGIAGFMYVYNKPIDQVYEHHTVNALYTSPPKREPLSEDEIADLWANKSPANEFECVRLVEKEHGIGVDDD